MKQFILIFQIIISILLVVSILLQAKGSGLGMAFGDTGGQYRSKRGIEKFLYRATIILVAFFLITSIVNLLIN